MAKYIITYKCGHTTEMQLFGKGVNRQNKIDWYKTIDCPHCRTLAAQASAEKLGFVQLKGSDKQIAWANDIRENSLKNIEQMRAAAKQPEVVNAMVEALLSNDSAMFWIDNRDDLNGGLVTFARYMIQTFYKK